MKAWFGKDNKMHFDADAWALIKKHARKQHRSPKEIVTRGLRRGMKLQEERISNDR